MLTVVMTEETWKQLEDAFAAALALDSEEQEHFVARFEKQYPELGSRLRDLLRADGEDDNKLREPIASSVESLADEATDPWTHRRIGSWSIVRRIASGGMGAVFLAERADSEYEQTVALKVMMAQMLAADATLRFQAERQILANLNHPNIAKLIDGGSTEENLPYLVMEYVDGMPIDRFCDARRLPVTERLTLFAKVCAAVDYAHRNLIVHRDLKPSNILVDANGEPRLLDFGIAKLLETGSYGQAMAVTRADARVMTPEFASPEQVRGEPPTIGADIYSLGVLLFRLLTGHSPYATDLDSMQSIERAIVEDAPRRPSTVVTSPVVDGNTAAEITPEETGSSRSTSPAQLQKRLTGDLDNIVLKTLQKDPERRYATAAQLADDIDRYLRHEPVRARPDSWAYRSGKFLRRNARPVAFTAAALLTIVLLVSFYTLRLAEERDRANLAAELSGEVSEFLVGLFDSASPNTSAGTEVTAIDLLDAGQNRIDALSEQPQLQAELNQIMGRSYTALGESTKAVELLENALRSMETRSEAEALTLANAHHSLAEAYRQDGQLVEAESHLREALAIREQQLGVDNADYAYTLGRLGVVLFDQRRQEEALAAERQALKILRDLGSTEDSATVDLMGNMANALDSLGRYDEAESMHRETILASERIDGELHPNTIIRISNLALVQIRTSQLDEALETITTALERGRQTWPDDHPQIAFMLATEGGALKRLGRMDDALQSYEASTDMARRISGPDSADYARRLRALGSMQRDLRQFAAAEQSLNEAQGVVAGLYGADSAQAQLVSIALGQVYNDQGAFRQAESRLRHALSGPTSLSRMVAVISERELGRSVSGQGRFDDAEPIIQGALSDRESLTSANDPGLISFLTTASEHYRRAGDLQQALSHAERAATIADTVESPGWLDVAAYAEYAKVLAALDERDEAEPYFRRAHEVLANTFDEDDDRVREIERYLGE